jgi:hypothetical protein
MATEVTHDAKLSNLEVTGATLCNDLRFKRNIISVTGENGSDVARRLLEAETGSIVTVDQSAGGAGDNVQISLPLAGDDTTASTATVGLVYEIHVIVAPGNAGALLEVSTGSDDVNFAAHSYITTDGAVVGGAGSSKLILTPATPAESLNTVIRCTCLTTTLWRIECVEPAATVTNFTAADAAAFA